MRETVETHTPLNPVEVALDLLKRSHGQHRNAEAEAWKLRAAHGPQTLEGQCLAQAAFVLADMYHDAARARDKDVKHYYDKVPVFEHGPNSSRME